MNKGTIERQLRKIARDRKKIEDPYKILNFILMTEKSVKLIETENKLSFITTRNASKDQIKRAFEEVFKQKVLKINVMNDQKNRKKAFIKLQEPGAAGELAVRLGII
ncbi:MAG: 50S ribosomal protein L23 [Candidatus Aenigmatarchaeota archaeon]